MIQARLARVLTPPVLMRSASISRSVQGRLSSKAPWQSRGRIPPTFFNWANNFVMLCRNSAASFGTRRGGGTRMKREEAKRLIINAWDQWIKTQPIAPDQASGRDSLKFYLELKDAQSPFLKFQGRGRDKWQIVHGWLRDQRRVSD